MATTTTIITKSGNGIPSSLEVGELAIDKSEPALYTNTGSQIEKIGTAGPVVVLGAAGVLWGSSSKYKNDGVDKYVQVTVNGVTPQVIATTGDETYYCVPVTVQGITWAAGDNTLILKPTAVGGNIVGFVPRDPPNNLTRIQIFIDGRLAYDGPEMFAAKEDQAKFHVGPMIGEEIKVIYTLSGTMTGGLQFGYVGAGIGF